MAHGDTGIRKLPGGRWEIRVSVVDPRTKNTVWKRKRIKGKKHEARAKREELREELRAELHCSDPENEKLRMRLKDYVVSWLQSKALRVKRSVIERYSNALSHVTPFIGDLYLDDITTQDIENWVQDMYITDNHKPTTINGWLRVLKSCIGDGRAELELPNPAARVKPLTEPPSEKKGLTPKELRTFIDAYDHIETKALIGVLSRTGMRWGEASALRWEDIDRENKVIHIRRAHYRSTVGLPKNGKHRTVPLSPTLDLMLQEHRQLLLKKQDLGFMEGWCFATIPTNGKNKGQVRLRTPSSIDRPWKKTCKKTGITATRHDLRRTFVDMLRLVGSDPILEHEYVGHADESMRRHYSTVTPEEGVRVITAIDDLVENGT